MSTELLGEQPSPPRPSRLSRRAVLARVALARAEGRPAPRPLPAPQGARLSLWPDRAAAGRLGRHGLLAALVLLVLGAELSLALSNRAARQQLSPAPAVAQVSDGAALAYVPRSFAPIRLNPGGEPLAPLTLSPLELQGAFQAFHRLAPGETLGELAARYGISLETLVLANGLERGDALVAGQELRIPRTSGLLYTVAQGDTADVVAARFGVTVEAIASLDSNQVGPTLGLVPGSEIFIPGARAALPADWLSAVGGSDGLGAQGATAAVALIRAAETNLRAGPSTEHPRLAQLDAGRRVALQARNGDWLLVALGATRGWVRGDMLDVAAAQVAELPISNDFPAPPPRWVWPARGTLTSGFGPRWRRFHNGIDIANRAWTPIVAARSGTVKEAGWCSGYGYCVKLRHDGGIETIYGHLVARPVVEAGEQVTAGELIGHMGSTYDRAGGGFSTGVHLHFTVLVNGKAVNPLKYLP